MTTPLDGSPSLQQIVQRLQQTSNPKQRYEYLLWLAKQLEEFPPSAKVAENKVIGCLSQVYVMATLSDNKVSFQGDSDAPITKGLVALLIRGLNGLAPREILQMTPDFIQATGLNTSLTPSRINGFYHIFRMMQQKALELAGQAENFTEEG